MRRPGRLADPRGRLAAIRRCLRGRRGPRRSRPSRRARDQLRPGLCSPAPVLIGHTQDDPHNCIGAAALDPRHHCSTLNTGDRVAPLPGELPDDTGGAYACYAYLRQPMHPCGYGSRRPDAIRVALIGDSHAAALLAALEPQLDALNWRVTAFTGADVCVAPARALTELPGTSPDPARPRSAATTRSSSPPRFASTPTPSPTTSTR